MRAQDVGGERAIDSIPHLDPENLYASHSRRLAEIPKIDLILRRVREPTP